MWVISRDFTLFRLYKCFICQIFVWDLLVHSFSSSSIFFCISFACKFSCVYVCATILWKNPCLICIRHRNYLIVCIQFISFCTDYRNRTAHNSPLNRSSITFSYCKKTPPTTTESKMNWWYTNENCERYESYASCYKSTRIHIDQGLVAQCKHIVLLFTQIKSIWCTLAEKTKRTHKKICAKRI